MRISDWSSDVCSSDLAPGKTPAACFHAADEQDQRRRNERPDREDCHHIAECRPPRLRRTAKEAEDLGLAGEKERRECPADQTHARERDHALPALQRGHVHGGQTPPSRAPEMDRLYTHQTRTP